MIQIGNNGTIVPFAYILAHDASTKRALGYTKIGSVVIEDNVFIGSRSMIMPGVTIGSNSIVVSCSVVTKCIPPDSVVAGNPTKIICTFNSYILKNKDMLNEINNGDEFYLTTQSDKSKRKDSTKNKINFIK